MQCVWVCVCMTMGAHQTRHRHSHQARCTGSKLMKERGTLPPMLFICRTYSPGPDRVSFLFLLSYLSLQGCVVPRDDATNKVRREREHIHTDLLVRNASKSITSQREKYTQHTGKRHPTMTNDKKRDRRSILTCKRSAQGEPSFSIALLTQIRES